MTSIEYYGDVQTMRRLARDVLDNEPGFKLAGGKQAKNFDANYWWLIARDLSKMVVDLADLVEGQEGGG